MTDRIDKFTQQFSLSRRPILMCALVAGDPYLDATLEYMNIIARHGADIIELMLPFSDPTYHGPVIQRAFSRALRESVSWEEIHELGQQFRRHWDTPVIVSSYYNRILATGLEKFSQTIETAGFDGVMVADLPWEEAAALENALGKRGLHMVPIVAPTTPLLRFEKIVKGAKGFVVWTGHSGGEVTISGSDFHRQMAEFRARTLLPMIAAMSVSTGLDAERVIREADGILVGTALVWLIEGRSSDISAQIEHFINDIRINLDFPHGSIGEFLIRE